MPPITHSATGAFAACPRRYWWGYELQLRPQSDGIPLCIGRAYHRLLELLNRGMTLENAIAAGDYSGLEAKEQALTICMASGWNWRWSEAPMFKKILATELVFEFEPFPGAGFTVAGKIDVVGECHDGAVGLGEYKTTREDISPVSDYWRRLLIDRQIGTYYMGGRSKGYPIDRVIYDAARVPAMRPRLLSRKKGETARENMEQYSARVVDTMGEKPDYYFGRHEIPRTQSDLDETVRDLAHYHGIIEQCRREGRWPRNTDACRRWGICPFFNPCVNNVNPEQDGTPSGFKRVEDVNVELLIEGETVNDFSASDSDEYAPA